MSKIASNSKTPALPADDQRVAMLRGAIASIPEAERAAVFAQLADLIPAVPAEPRRGRELLNKVYLIYKNERAPRGVPEIAKALEAEGVSVPNSRALYNCVGYLKSRKIIQKVEPGKYVLSDGSIVQTDIEKGGELEY